MLIKVLLQSSDQQEVIEKVCDLFLDEIKKTKSGLLTQREYNALIMSELNISTAHANNIYYKKFNKFSQSLFLKLLDYIGCKITFTISKDK